MNLPNLTTKQLSELDSLFELVSKRQKKDFGNISASNKADGSLLTSCDLWSDKTIVDGLSSIAPGEGVLSEEGKQFNSVELCSLLLNFKNKKINFLIGDTDGISSDIKNNSDLILSLSPLTFPHELARLILVEQIYRAVSISNNSPYHRS